MVLIHRWSLYAGSIAWEVVPLHAWEPVEYGLYKQVAFIYTGGLSSRFHCICVKGRTFECK